MTDGQQRGHEAGGEEPLERLPRSYWQLMPKRTLVKGVWLLLMLATIFWFQARASSCARVYTETIAPTAPGAASQDRNSKP